MKNRIDCYNSQSKKVCEIYPEELSAQELDLVLELQAYQGRVCLEREGKMTKICKRCGSTEYGWDENPNRYDGGADFCSWECYDQAEYKKEEEVKNEKN